MKTNYLNLKYQPNKQTEIIATYYLESEIGLNKGSIEIAKESSIGTWTNLTGLTAKIFNRLAPQIFYINPKQNIVKIAYPLELFELGNIPQLLSGLAGNIFSMKVVKNIRLLDLDFPKKYLDSFQGPFFGSDGIRNILKIYNRPLIGSIIKPKVGLNSLEQAKLAYTVWKNGVDIIKDDENLTSLPFNSFKNRVDQVLKLRKQAEKETGHLKMYVFNVTGPADLMLKRAKYVQNRGGRCVMIDLVSCGIDNIHFLRKQNLKLILHGHRAGHSAFSRNPKHGISMLVIAKLARLAGIDQLHTGTVIGKMEGETSEVISINKAITSKTGWSKIKPVMPIASGGLHPALIPELVKILGKNIIINFGGGLHGHPGGSAAGARACRESIEAVERKISLKQYAKTHSDLNIALKHWQSQ
jgi:ribulose-bisphosphate carboxylase large chain